MIFNIVQNFPIQTFNGHCYALKTGLEYITYHVPMMLAVKNDVSVLFERCNITVAYRTETHKEAIPHHDHGIMHCLGGLCQIGSGKWAGRSGLVAIWQWLVGSGSPQYMQE